MYVFSIVWYVYLAVMSYVDYTEQLTHKYDDPAYKKAKAIVESIPEDALAKVTIATLVIVGIGVLIDNMCV